MHFSHCYVNTELAGLGFSLTKTHKYFTPNGIFYLQFMIFTRKTLIYKTRAFYAYFSNEICCYYLIPFTLKMNENATVSNNGFLQAGVRCSAKMVGVRSAARGSVFGHRKVSQGGLNIPSIYLEAARGIQYNALLLSSLSIAFFRYLLQRLSSLNMKRSDWPPQIAL